MWTLLSAILALMAIRDWDINWRRLKLAGIAGLFAFLLLIAGVVFQQFVLPVTSRYLYILDRMEWLVIAALSVLFAVVGYGLSYGTSGTLRQSPNTTRGITKQAGDTIFNGQRKF